MVENKSGWLSKGDSIKIEKLFKDTYSILKNIDNNASYFISAIEFDTGIDGERVGADIKSLLCRLAEFSENKKKAD